ncbi:hypothetical protein JKF63_01358 [Porcisia hertigi]|uniref:Integral membrane bound transporter domain-containing protein n=1 Tax=Porcisia hertigi TaxID=2761500 RepID=A0A836IEA5_9TRYP|nr:hypothetical protein JKF63_01358 [Porcisia hertigi]
MSEALPLDEPGITPEAHVPSNTGESDHPTTNKNDPLTSAVGAGESHQSKVPPPPLPHLASAPVTPVALLVSAEPLGTHAKSFIAPTAFPSQPSTTEIPKGVLDCTAIVSGETGDQTHANADCQNPCKEDDVISLDSLGIPRYNPRYPEGGTHCHGDASVPWNLRPSMRRTNCTFFDCLRAPQFWHQFEFAIRITALAVLLPASLIAAKLPGSPFVSPFMVISSSVLAAKRTSGESIAYVFNWIRAGCFWLPLSVIAGALNLGHHIVSWCVYYTAMLFLMAVFTEGIVRRICLLLFNGCAVGLLLNKNHGAVFPCRVMVDWCIGTGLCVVAAFFPYPLFCKREAQRLLCDIARNTATAYRGLVYSFWSPSNVERNMAMSKVHIMTDSLDELLPLFEHYQSFSFYEFFFEPAEVRDIRALKFALFERLRINLSSMTRVLDMVQEKPSAVDNSERSKAFAELLNPHLNAVAEVFDKLVDLLVHAKSCKALLDLHESYEEFSNRTDALQDAFNAARRSIFYECTPGILEEFVPLMTFYLFTVVCVRDTINIFQAKVKAYHPSIMSTIKQIWMKMAWEPLKDNADFLKRLFTRWNRREVQRVIEAAKVSGAMILTIGFSFLIKIDKASFSGPNIIAFVSGSNPVEALQESIVRLTGCLLGTVLGFFAGTFSGTPVQRVASLCTLMFCGTFLRFDKEYGVMAVYGMFVLIPLVSITETTVGDTVARMNQNTFGIFIYLLVSVTVLPLSPGWILRAKRSNILRCMSSVISSMMDLFSEPLVHDHTMCKYAHAENDETEDEAPMPNACSGGIPTHLMTSFSNRSIHILSKKDTAMQHIDAQLDELLRRLKGTKEMMRFARDERTLVEVDYPIKSCELTYQHMYRMTMLLKTMWMSWNVIRSQRSYTVETRHMLRNLQPVALDVAGAFQRCVDLMCYMIRKPSINLEVAIMKAVLDMIESADVLHCRKSQIMLMLINQSVNNHVASKGSGDVAGSTSGANVDPTTRRQPDLHHSDERRLKPTHEDATMLSFGGSVLPSQSPEIYNSSAFSCGPSEHNARPASTLACRRGIRHAATFQALCNSPPTSTFASPVSQGYNFQVLTSERNVSVMPYLRRAGARVSSDQSSSLFNGVHLPSTFQFPLTSEDVEGLHSFTLSMEMFANETKLLMMSITALVDNLRQKL